MAYPKTPASERFANKYLVDQFSGCWIWTDAPDKDGYGRLQIDGKAVKAHRLSYELHTGPVPSDILVCHSCDNPICVNPNHLFLGTNLDNIADMVRKGRAPRVKNPRPGEANGNAAITEDQAKEILRMNSRGIFTQAELAAQFGLHRDSVRRIIHGKSWSHLERPSTENLSPMRPGRWGAQQRQKAAA